MEAPGPARDELVTSERIGDEKCPTLPRELARLHGFGYGLGEEMALAPWPIDHATDLLFEPRTRPRAVFWLAASALETLFWGLERLGALSRPWPIRPASDDRAK